MAAAVTKLTVNLPDDVVNGLKEYAGKRGISMTEALRQMIVRGLYFDEEVNSGSKLLIEGPNKNLREVVTP